MLAMQMHRSPSTVNITNFRKKNQIPANIRAEHTRTESIRVRLGEVRYQLRSYQHRSASQSRISNQPSFVSHAHWKETTAAVAAVAVVRRATNVCPRSRPDPSFLCLMNKNQLLAHKCIQISSARLFISILISFRFSCAFNFQTLYRSIDADSGRCYIRWQI